MAIVCNDCGEINPGSDHVCLMSKLKKKDELEDMLPQRKKPLENL